MARLIVVPVGDDVAIVEVGRRRVGDRSPEPGSDPPFRSGRRSTTRPQPCIAGARQMLVDLARTVLSAEAVGMARECTELAAEYAKERQQFGRPIAMFQAVKHHCANMAVATELATGAVWDAARAAAGGGDQLSYAGSCRRGAVGPGGRPVRQPEHPGPRRNRHHLGVRRPPLHPSGSRAAPVPPGRFGCRTADRPGPQGRGAAQGRRPATGGRGDPGRGAGVRGARQGSPRRRKLDALLDTGYVDAALAEAVRTRRGCHRAAGDRGGVRQGRGRTPQARASPHGTSSR